MAKTSRASDPEANGVRPLAKHDTVGTVRTSTTPELEKGGLSDSPRIVTSLLLYGTDTLYLLPKL